VKVVDQGLHAGAPSHRQEDSDGMVSMTVMAGVLRMRLAASSLCAQLTGSDRRILSRGARRSQRTPRPLIVCVYYCVYVYYCRTYYKAVCRGGEGDSEGHVL
jgi:hypothetical protein